MHGRSSQEPKPGARPGPVPGSGPGPGFSQEAPEVPRRIPGYYRLLPIACRLLHIACCHIVLYLYVYIYIFNCSTGRLHACLMHRLPHQSIPSSLTRVSSDSIINAIPTSNMHATLSFIIDAMPPCLMVQSLHELLVQLLHSLLMQPSYVHY